MKSQSMMKWRVRRDSRCNSIDHEDIRRSLEMLDSVLAEFDDDEEDEEVNGDFYEKESSRLSRPSGDNSQCQENGHCLFDESICSVQLRNKQKISDDGTSVNSETEELHFHSLDGTTSLQDCDAQVEQLRKYSPPPVPKRSPATRLSNRENGDFSNSKNSLLSTENSSCSQDSFKKVQDTSDIENEMKSSSCLQNLSPKLTVKNTVETEMSNSLLSYSQENVKDLSCQDTQTVVSNNLFKDSSYKAEETSEQDDVFHSDSFITSIKFSIISSNSEAEAAVDESRKTPSVASLRSLYEKKDDHEKDACRSLSSSHSSPSLNRRQVSLNKFKAKLNSRKSPPLDHRTANLSSSKSFSVKSTAPNVNMSPVLSKHKSESESCSFILKEECHDNNIDCNNMLDHNVDEVKVSQISPAKFNSSNNNNNNQKEVENSCEITHVAHTKENIKHEDTALCTNKDIPFVPPPKDFSKTDSINLKSQLNEPDFHDVSSNDDGSLSKFSTVIEPQNFVTDTLLQLKASAELLSKDGNKCHKCDEHLRLLNEKFEEVKYLLKTNQISLLDRPPPSFVPPPPPPFKKVKSQKTQTDNVCQLTTDVTNYTNLSVSVNQEQNKFLANSPGNIKKTFSIQNSKSSDQLARSVDKNSLDKSRNLMFPSPTVRKSPSADNVKKFFPNDAAAELAKLLPVEGIKRPPFNFSYSMEEDLSPGIKEILTSTPKSDVSEVSPKISKENSSLSTFSQSFSSLGYGSSQSDIDLNVSIQSCDKIPVDTIKSQTLPVGAKLQPSPFYSSDEKVRSEGSDSNKTTGLKVEEEVRSSSAPPLKHLGRSKWGLGKKEKKERKDKKKNDDSLSVKSDLSLDDSVIVRRVSPIDGSTDSTSVTSNSGEGVVTEEKTKRRSVWKSILRRK